MRGPIPARPHRRWTLGATALWLASCTAPCAAGAPRFAFSAGPLIGTTVLDPRFADFDWDVRPRVAWGGEARVGLGDWGGELRTWRAASTQTIDPGRSSATVALTSVEVVGERRVLSLGGTELAATGSAGGLWLGYRPDQVTFVPAGSSPIVVDLTPIHTWTAGAGLELRRPWIGPWNASLALEWQAFPLDVTHRNGSAVETRRESFGEWSARLGLAWNSWRP